MRPESVPLRLLGAHTRAPYRPARFVQSLRASFALLAVLLPAVAAAQPADPVLLVHGLKSSEATWRETVAHLEGLGYGTPYTYHFDLNATTLTLAEADVVGPAVAPYWDFVSSTAALADSAGVDSVAVALGADARRSLRATGPTDSRLFAVNFETWYDWDSNTIIVHDDRNAPSHSESHCSAVAKQGLALRLAIEDVLAWTGADRVTLVGHSMGGLAIREYLQRRTAEGAPRWWVEPGASGGHRVGAVVTTGTPHQGSNTVNFGFFCADTEATRDLRYSYLSTGEVAPYLYGGDEDIQAYWHNDDVNADGVEGGPVVGLNVGDPSGVYSYDNPAIPLPTDVAYTYIYSHADAIVTAERQLVQFLATDGLVYLSPYGSARAARRDVGHLAQPGDYEMIAWAVETAVWTSSEPPVPGSQLESSVWPNPARDRATVQLSVPTPVDVRLAVVDALGRVVLQHDLGARPAGETRFDLDLSTLAAGVYVLRTFSGDRDGAPVVFSVTR
ncbi:MAG: hypothetical protein CMM84_19170 [Rhodothermaceae bacterium]|nr:hypothetical protein [Rhodothermaceae bacterium]MBC13128.1 hypothetical protein [Rhodothermaceae bacterium]